MNDRELSSNALLNRYAASLPDKLSALSLAWEQWLARPSDTQAKAEFHALIHRLAGSAGAYGLSDIAQHAQGVDEFLLRWDAEIEALREPLAQLNITVAPGTELLLRALRRACRDARAGDVSAELPTPVPDRTLYVLYVEDDPEQAASWREALAREGLRVRTVSDRHALQSELVLELPDVLLIDFWLEPHTGVELSRLLRDVPEFAGIPKVCLTVDGGPVPRQTAMDAGFAAVLRKSIAPADLAEVLRQIVATAQHRR